MKEHIIEDKIIINAKDNPEHQSEKIRFRNLEVYIGVNSDTLLENRYLSEELSGMAEAGKGILGYYDNKDVQFSVDGYDFVYFDQEGNLKHVKIVPEEIDELKKSGKLHEGDEVEEKLREAGYNLDQSEKFRSAIWRQLHNG